MTTPSHLQVMLPNGEMLTAAEILDGFLLLAEQTSPFPFLSRDDLIKACVNLAFEAVERTNQEGSGG